MIKNKLIANRKIILFIFIFALIISLAVVGAILAFPSGTTDLRAQTCNSESTSSTSGSFSGSCTGTYPAACPTDRISCNDGTTETATTSANNQFMGFKITSFNNTLANCGSITNVKICYEWWSSSASIGTCAVNVDANGGASNTTVSSTCPGTGANPGEICTDVTSSESWVCGNFFTSSGTRAIASLEVRATSGGSKTLTVDSFYFNVTYTSDTSPPTITINYPANTTYTSNVTTLNSTVSDTNLQACRYSLNGGVTNTTFTCGNNITGINAGSGSSTWTVYANDSFGNANSTSVTFSVNLPPIISNATALPNPVAGSSAITIYANTTSHGVNDTEGNTLQFFCSDNSAPTSSNTNCTGGTTSDSTYPYVLTCSFTSESTSGDYIKYCRVYDGLSYSSAVQANYTVNATVLTTSIVSVAGDTSASYFDTVNDALTEIIVSGESGMSCRWSSSDLAYSGMSNSCSVAGTQGNCSVNDAASQGFTTRYVSCQNSLGTGQNASQNLDVSFFLDYTAPTTSDNSVSTIKAPNYTVTITEADNVDSDPTTLYCTDTSGSCTPSLSIDNGGTVTFTSSNRGVNYLRYYSTDDAGNVQTTQNITININRLPVLSSASDNAGTILGGTTVTITTVSLDADSGQNLRLYVCNSSSANYSGCGGTQYCTALSSANVSCGFASETDSSTHTWYAYIFDSLNESASANPLTGSYTTDSTSSTITLSAPTNGSTITQTSVTITITVNEALSWAAYSLNGNANVTMSNSSLLEYSHSNLSIANGQYNLTLYANDSYGNLAASSGYVFTIDTTAGDTTKPEITIRSPVNNSYYTNGTILLNITTDESLSWAGYTNNSGTLRDLGNISTTNWNATIILAEGQHNITFYANDSSSNKNQGNKSIVIYIDLTNPSVSSFSCTPNPANDSGDVNCSASISDSIGLNYAIIAHNATGTWQNSSQINISGLSSNISYVIASGNTTPPAFRAEIYAYDLSGRVNGTAFYNVNVSDDIFPTIWNITYSPNTTAGLDPYVRININATVIENYKIDKVELMWQNLSDGNWISVSMTNNSAIANGSSATVVYNASFLPGNGTYAFRINATDLAGNMNVSSNITITAANESSFWNGTTIPEIKSFTYSQRSDNNTLGILYINNTGDENLNFTINITDSTIRTRFNLNSTGTPNATYSLSPGNNLSLTYFINTTSLTAALYDYNLTISSSVGSTILERKINIQTAFGPYLDIEITTFSSTVTTSQTGVSYAVSVTNLGTQDASDVYLNWTLPSIFTLSTGNLSRSLGTLPIGSSGTNTITVNVGSSTSDITYYINATATASNADSVNTSKAITVSNPVTITETVVTPAVGGGGGGDGSGAAGRGGGAGGGALESAAFSEAIEIIRGPGGEASFDISITPRYENSRLENLILTLTGFPEQYITISPSTIYGVSYGETENFRVTLRAPSYESYEEIDLTAVIEGDLVRGNVTSKYRDMRTIRLIIQEVSLSPALDLLEEARQFIDLMKKEGFNTDKVETLLQQAEQKLKEKRNKEALDLAKKIIEIKDLAFEADELIKKILSALKDPRKISLITGNVPREIVDENGEVIFIDSLITGKVIFEGKESGEVLNLALAAFKRGDYAAAIERAKSAQVLLILERKGNFGLFLYLYWHFVLIGAVFFSVAGILGYRQYRKSFVTRKIENINKEELNIKNLIIENQRGYFSGKISAEDYHRIMDQHQKEISRLKKSRLNLRNKRISLLKPQQILQDLEIEKMQVEAEIKKLQEAFYNSRKITEQEYKIGFEILNGRLAEIEDERTTLKLLREKKVKQKNKSRGKG